MNYSQTVTSQFSRKPYFLLFAIFLLFFPTILGFQPFLPKTVQNLFLLVRFILIPVAVLFYYRSNINLLTLIVFFLFFSISIIYNNIFRKDELMINSLILFASFFYFKLGFYLTEIKEDISRYFKYLLIGVTLFNFLTILVYLLIVNDFIDVMDIYETIQRDNDPTIFRFSLGNSIELPFVMTCIVFCCVRGLPNNYLTIISTLVNLIVVLISQSRLVIFMALILFFKQILSSKAGNKLIFLVILCALLLFYWEDFVGLILSIYDRFQGNDYGSKEDRIFLFDKFLDKVNPLNLLLGNGFLSSTDLVQASKGEYRTIESLFLQLVYEFGFIGCLLLLSIYFIDKHKVYKPVFSNVFLLLVYVQVLFFLPLFSGFPIIMFLIGQNSLEHEFTKAQLTNA
jgi:uncharacterized membrane protein YsdA (DUF1294 family)